ncbi:MAG: hypothetical protein NTV06_01675 [candidate division Zixibacteria bacterium]|nr:hypothetical protein [candidate division Zixibacteria bacterium]
MKKRVLFSAITIIAILLLLEFSARVLEMAFFKKISSYPARPGWQTEFFKSFLDWHEPDPDLLWRFRANLDNPLIKTNSSYLLCNEISAKKDKTVFRILLLGDSSPVGIGLKSRHQAFGELTRYFLETEYAGIKNFELVNAAVSGYTSEQIVRFLELHGWQYQPDLIVLYCGNNDASISGNLSDRQLLENEKLKGLRQFFSPLALYRVMKNFLIIGKDTGSLATGSLKVRVSAEEYAENLKIIADQCQEHNCPLVILKPPVPLLWPAGLQFKVFLNGGDYGKVIFPEPMLAILGSPLKYCLDRRRFQEIYGRGDIFTRNVYLSAYDDSLAPLTAISRYRELLRSDSGNAVILNNLGVSYWQNNQYADADHYLKLARNRFIQLHKNNLDIMAASAGSPFLFNIGIDLLSSADRGETLLADTAGAPYHYLDSALQADYFSLRIKREYWRKIDALSGQKNITVTDLPVIFALHGGERLFIDHCHPTAEGHRLIAEALKGAIKNANYIH